MTWNVVSCGVEKSGKVGSWRRGGEAVDFRPN